MNQILNKLQSVYLCLMAHFLLQWEENYLKTIYTLGSRELKVNNIILAKTLKLNPATVLEMVRKLAAKNLVQLKKDKTIVLTEKGQKRALQIIRRHRLWEVFLVEKLNYKWSEVHDLAEQLEHIESADLVDKLAVYLNHPAVDPHGDPIPDKNGKMPQSHSVPLTGCEEGKNYRVTNFTDTNDQFLEFLEKLDIHPGKKIKLVERHSYDLSCTISVQKQQYQLSEKVAGNILVMPA